MRQRLCAVGAPLSRDSLKKPICRRCGSSASIAGGTRSGATPLSSSPSTSSHSNQPGYRRINRLPQPLLPATVPTTGTVARLSFFHARPSHKTRPRPQTPISASTGTAPSTSRERSTPDRATSMESLRCCAAGPEKEPLSDISSSSSVFLSSLTSGPVHRTHLAAQAQHASGSTIKSGGCDRDQDCWTCRARQEEIFLCGLRVFGFCEFLPCSVPLSMGWKPPAKEFDHPP